MDDSFSEKIAYIEGALRDAGYDPYAQLIGFVRTNDDRYITRRGGARNLIRELDWSMLKRYVRQIEP